ncbi:uncharacterized protein LOC114358295 [Ostrinia furnacalis]|uniref:uncharacterized protein LOC114358295 n=1 Tax=Ostrinia furnacalis TaxID=93504 RepID=UPI001039F7A0|nr:uncharacterized protein LOC114358295 [Ostrinia furnacalis]
MGIGTPSPAALINVNWAFQANFQLPWNRSQIPFDILVANNGITTSSRKKREDEIGDYENDSRLYHFYKYVEGALDGFGHNGTACVFRTLCQLGAEPLHSTDDDLLHEIAAYVLNPKNDIEHTLYLEEIHPYVTAYTRGENQEDCTRIYSPCTISLLDLFTKAHTVS